MTYETTAEPGLTALVKRRWRAMALTTGLSLAVGIPMLFVLPKSYQASAKLLVMRTEQRFGGLGILHNSLPELGGTSQPLFTQVELIRLPTSLRRVIETLDLRNDKGELLAVDELDRRIRVAPIKGTDLIELSYRDRDPLLAQRVVEALCTVYLESTEATRRERVMAGVKIVDEHLETAQDRLQEAEARLQEFKQSLGSVSLDQEIRASVGGLNELDQLIRHRRLALESLQAKASSLRSRLRMSPQEAMEAVTLAQSPRIRSLQEQLVEAETSPLRTQGLAPGHPELVALDARITMLKRELSGEIQSLVGQDRSLSPLDEIQLGLLRELTSVEAEMQATQAGMAAAERSRAALSASMKQLPAHERTLERLQREVQIAGQIYQDLLHKRAQAQQHLSNAPSYAQLVQAPAIPERPLNPLGGQAATILLLASMGAGFGVGSLREATDRRISPSALAEYLPEIPLFCSLPYLSKAELRSGELVVKSLASPAYMRGLLTLGLGLENHLGGFGGKVLVMTSTSPGEGKSMTVANLALCLRDLGKRVLLVDADLRRPRLHTIFRQDRPGKGLAELLLTGRALPEAIRRKEGIALVTAGTADVPLKQDKVWSQFQVLLDRWRTEYDVVLVDLPPLSIDAMVSRLAKHADGTIFLGNVQMMHPDVLLSGVHLLKNLDISPLAAVAISATSVPAESSYYVLASEAGRP